MKCGSCLWCVLWLLLVAVPARAGLKDGDCLDCHGDNTLYKTNSAGKAISLFVDSAKLKLSAHRTNACISCHADITTWHPEDNSSVLDFEAQHRTAAAKIPKLLPPS